MQVCQGLFCAVLDGVLQDDGTGIGAVHGGVDHGGALHHGNGQAQGLHQPQIARVDLMPADPGADALTGDLPDLGCFLFCPSRLDDGPGDGVMAGIFRRRHQFQQVSSFGIHPHHPEIAGGQGAGLVEHEGIHLRQVFQGDAALGDHARPAHRAHAREIGQGHGDDQRAGTADHQEIQCPVDPGGEVKARKQRRDKCKGQGRINHARGVDLGKAGDEALGFGPALAGRVHQIQDPRHGGGCKFALRPNGQHAGQIDTAGQDLVPRRHIGWNRLTGDLGSIDRGTALDDDAVHGDALAGVHPDQVTHLDILGVGFLPLSVDQDVGHIGPQVHEGSNRLSGPLHSDGLKKLAHLEKQHNRRRFHEFPQEDGTNGSHGHEEILVKGLLRPDLLKGIPQDLMARGEPGGNHENFARIGDELF